MRFLSMIAAALLLLLPAPLRADEALDALAKSMGADKVRTIQYSARGYFYALGQSARAGGPWPKFRLQSYSLSADYDGRAVAQDMHYVQYLNPPRGGNFQPLGPDGLRRKLMMKGDVVWTQRGNAVTASRGARGEAAYLLWTSPQGVVKAAQAQNAAVDGPAAARTVAFESKGNWRAVAVFDERGLLARVETRMANPVMGDMLMVTTYGNYKRFGGIPFPTRIATTAGGHPVLELNVTAARPNAPVEIAAPANLREAQPRVTMDKVANGVWFVAGGSHNSVAVEMRDHIVVIEGPLGDARANAAIDAVKKTIPGKPITFVIDTHHHFDHSGGLRAFVAEGAAIVTHRLNKPFFEAAYAAPWTIRPDRMAKSGRHAEFVTMDDSYAMDDGTHRIELYRVRGDRHADDMIIAYLPKEKVLVVADLFSPRRLLKAPVKKVPAATANLWRNIQRLKLDIATVLPIHGQKVGLDQFQMALGRKPAM